MYIYIYIINYVYINYAYILVIKHIIYYVYIINCIYY